MAATSGIKESFNEKALENEQNTPYRAYKMPQGHTLYMTPEMRENIPHNVMQELGRLTAGKDTIITSPKDYVAAVPPDTPAANIFLQANRDNDPGAYSYDKHKLIHPLHNVAPNIIWIPNPSEIDGTLKKINNDIPDNLLDKPENTDFFSFALLHEAAHIKDGVEPNIFHKLFMDLNKENKTLANEAYADSHAAESCTRIGLGHIVDYIIAVRSIRRSLKDMGDHDTAHDTSALIKEHPPEDAESFLRSATKHYGEAKEAFDMARDVCEHIVNKELSEEQIDKCADAWEKIDKEIKDSPTITRDQIKVAQEVCAQYVTTKALLAENKITDPEQKAYAQTFVDSLEKSMSPDILHIIESEMVGEFQAVIHSGATDEIIASHEEKPANNCEYTAEQVASLGL